MPYDTLLTEFDEDTGVAVIQMNRPDALNALSEALMNDLTSALDRCDKEDKVGCVILTGSKKAFSGGADIKEIKDKTYPESYYEDFISRNWERTARLRKPIIAAVAGYAVGGGCELALMCDIILAADNAKFGQPEVRLGVMPGAGGTQRLTRAIGKSKTMELCLTGRLMDAGAARFTTHLTEQQIVAYPEELVQRPDTHPMTYLAGWMAQMHQPDEFITEAALVEGLLFIDRLAAHMCGEG